MKQLFTILYMSTKDDLIETIERLIKDGCKISVVTHLREMTEPNMDGIVYTDWLIIYGPTKTQTD